MPAARSGNVAPRFFPRVGARVAHDLRAAAGLATHGGLLVPSPVPPGGQFTLFTQASGGFTLPGPWPAGVPAGVTLYFQAWVVDPPAIAGVSASNGLSATTP